MGLRSFAIAAAVAVFSVLQAPAALAQPGAKSNPGGRDPPAAFVVCTGWHALCSASPDCRMTSGDTADCDCMRVDETHVVMTDAIQDVALRKATLARCTERHPCEVDEAPVCRALKERRYTVQDVRYDWVSTYSYRGWCGLLSARPVACDPRVPGYVGDAYWALCDAAPCTENPDPADPNRPLRCRCPIRSDPFVGLGTCTGTHGGIMSSMTMSGWDFRRNTYTFAMPGYEYVGSACAPVGSDAVGNPAGSAPGGR